MRTRNQLPPLAGLFLAVFGLTACSTPPAPTPVEPTPVTIIEQEPEPILPPGVTISPPQTGDATVAFQQSRAGERTFPNNQIGASLVFTSNLRMPKLEAAEISADGFQLRMRFRNAVKEPLLVSMVCAFEGDASTRQIIRSVKFPVNTFRDITIDLVGNPGQRISIRASAVPASSPSP
jgi:hypothetical protein